MKRAKGQPQKIESIFEFTDNQEEVLAKILTHIFSDQYIITEKLFRKLLEDNPQGYIHLDKLLASPLIDNFFKQNKIESKAQKTCYIRVAIESYCPQLYYHLGRIRRVNPFDLQRFKSIKPICLQKLPQNITISDLQSYFNQKIDVCNPSSLITLDQDVLVYSLKYRQNMAEILKKKPPFEILDYQAYYRQYDLSFRLRERKHKQLCKPIEMPKHNISEIARRASRRKMQEDYDDNLEQYYQNTDYRSLQRVNLQKFINYCRKPNIAFNSLLSSLSGERIDIQN